MTARRPLIVGYAPSRTSDPKRPLSGPCGDRLADLMGVSALDFVRRFERVNVFDAWPGKDGKGDGFDPLAAFDRAKEIDIRGRKVLLLGRRVAAAFGLECALEPCVPKLVEFPPSEFVSIVVMVPHPSGVNLWWNSEENRERARKALRDFARVES